MADHLSRQVSCSVILAQEDEDADVDGLADSDAAAGEEGAEAGGARGKGAVKTEVTTFSFSALHPSAAAGSRGSAFLHVGVQEGWECMQGRLMWQLCARAWSPHPPAEVETTTADHNDIKMCRRAGYCTQGCLMRQLLHVRAGDVQRVNARPAGTSAGSGA
jgi:hypothetical protein